MMLMVERSQAFPYAARMKRDLAEYVLVGSALTVFIGGLCYLAYALLMTDSMRVYASQMGLG